MVTLLAQVLPDEDEDRLFRRVRQIRSQAWPNSRMLAFADDLLGRGGRLVEALCRHYRHQMMVNPKIEDWMNRNGRGREVEMALR